MDQGRQWAPEPSYKCTSRCKRHERGSIPSPCSSCTALSSQVWARRGGTWGRGPDVLPRIHLAVSNLLLPADAIVPLLVLTQGPLMRRKEPTTLKGWQERTLAGLGWAALRLSGTCVFLCGTSLSTKTKTAVAPEAGRKPYLINENAGSSSCTKLSNGPLAERGK